MELFIYDFHVYIHLVLINRLNALKIRRVQF